jgi:thiol:disulfide interchange protein
MIALLLLALQTDDATIKVGKIEFLVLKEEGKEYEETLKKAGKEKLPVFLYFTCGCRTCKKFTDTCFAEEATATQSKKFLRLYVPTKVQKEITEKHGAEVCPHIVFLDPDGKEWKAYRKRELIGMKTEDFKKALDEAVKELIDKKKSP